MKAAPEVLEVKDQLYVGVQALVVTEYVLVVPEQTEVRPVSVQVGGGTTAKAESERS